MEIRQFILIENIIVIYNILKKITFENGLKTTQNITRRTFNLPLYVETHIKIKSGKNSGKLKSQSERKAKIKELATRRA